MPNNLNETCLVGNSGGNIGQTACSYTLGRTVGLISTPYDDVIPAANLDNDTTIRAYLKSKLQATSYEARWQIIGTFIDATSQGQEAGYFSYPDRSRVLTQAPIKGTQYEHKNGFCYHQQLMRYNGSNRRYFRIAMTTDNQLVIVGTLIQGANGTKSFAGIATSMFYAVPPVDGTQTDPERYYLQVEDADINESTINRAVFPVNNGLIGAMATLSVKDVSIENRTPTGASAGVFTVRLNISCGSKSLAEVVPAVISTTNILVKNNKTGAAITSTMAVDTTDAGNVVITADTADTDYPASGEFISIKLAGLGVILSTIGAYESDNLLIQVP